MTNIDYYKPVFNRWAKGLGPLPTPELIHVARALSGTGRDGKHTLAVAMYLRPQYGATDSEVRAAVAKLNPVQAAGGRQGVLHNYRRDYEAAGLITRDMNAAPRDAERVYQVTLTPKGERVVAKFTEQRDKRHAAAAEGARARGEAPKPKAARKRKPVAADTVAAAPVADTVAADTVAAAPVADTVAAAPVADTVA